MKASLKTEFNRELFRQRQTVLQTHDGKTIRAVDAVFQLIAASHRSVLAEPCFNSDLSFPARSRAGKAVGSEVGNRHDRRCGQSLREKYFCQGAKLIAGAECRLRRISRIGIAQVLFSLR